MFKIGEFSRLAQVPIKTLRYYDEVGLLKPAQVDKFTDYRYYRAEQLARLNRILAFKDLGFTLEEVARLLDENVSPEQLRGMLRFKEAEIRERVEEEQARLARVRARLRLIEQENQMPNLEVVIKKIPAQRVAAIRSIIPNYAAQGMLWGELDAYLAQKQVSPNGACFAVYYDTEYRERDVDVEVCEPINANVSANGKVKVYELPTLHQVAAVLHRGGFENISESYSQLLQWIGANGFRIVGPNREVYLRAVVSPELLAKYPSEYVTTNEAERLTEIQFPIEKA
mgnify:FL=1